MPKHRDLMPDTRTNHLFVIAINDYSGGINPLNSPVREAKKIVKILTENYHFLLANQTVLFDEDATRRNISQQFGRLLRSLTPNDNLLIYFAGHGHYEDEIGYLMPKDAVLAEVDTYIHNSFLIDYVKNIRTHHTFLILDSCFSGNIFRESRKVANQLAAENLDKFKSRIGLTSGSNEKVDDGVADNDSPFAEALVSYLRDQPDLVFTAGALIQHIKNVVPNNAKQQPRGGIIPNTSDQGGEFIFRRIDPEPKAWEVAQESDDIKTYKAFLTRFSDSEHRATATERIAALEESDTWEHLNRDNMTALVAFIEKYPDSSHADTARELINAIEEQRDWKTAEKRNTIFGYLNFKKTHPSSLFCQNANDAIHKLNDANDEIAWKNAKKLSTIAAFEDYLTTWEKGKFRAEAQTEIDNIKGYAQTKADRIAAEKEAKRLADAKIEADKLAADQLAAEKEADRLADAKEAARLAAAKIEADRLADAKEAARLAAEKIEAARLAAEEIEAARIAAEKEAKRLAVAKPAKSLWPYISGGGVLLAAALYFGKPEFVPTPPNVIDTDGDTVFDSKDNCPNEFGLVELQGCPKTEPVKPDPVKSEPKPEPAKTEPAKPADRDKDGVPDNADNCPTQRGTKANGGCPDTDGDGVIDNEDDCPDIYGTKGNHGCKFVPPTNVPKIDKISHPDVTTSFNKETVRKGLKSAAANLQAEEYDAAKTALNGIANTPNMPSGIKKSIATALANIKAEEYSTAKAAITTALNSL